MLSGPSATDSRLFVAVKRLGRVAFLSLFPYMSCSTHAVTPATVATGRHVCVLGTWRMPGAVMTKNTGVKLRDVGRLAAPSLASSW